MDEIFKPQERPKSNFGILLAGSVLAILVIGGCIWLWSLRPSIEDQKASILANAHKPGSPEFEELNKDIIISTDDRTVESPTGLGTISMFINGKIHNKGNRTIDTLEVNVAVVTQFNDVLRERRMLVVPQQQPVLSPGETIPITLTVDGFSPQDDRANIRWRVTAIKAQ